MKVGGERTAEDGDYFLRAIQQFFGKPDLVGYNFRLLWTVCKTVSAADTALEDDLGIALLDLYRLDRTASYAGIALAALFGHCCYRLHRF